MTHSESPEDASAAFDRREFLRLMGASLALSGAVGCTSRPRERVLPYVEQPKDVVPGRPSWFATSMTFDGYAMGLLVESHEGRPTKIEGHPEHPASLGGASLHAQASILGLYDPDRARGAREHDRPVSWDRFVATFRGPGPRGPHGRGLRFLLEPTSSPLVGSVLERLSAALPEAHVHFHTPLGARRRWDGARAAFGRVVDARYDFGHANVVVALDADFLGAGPTAVRYARDFASRRRIQSAEDPMSRLYVAETNLSITGGRADHRLRVKPSDVLAVARALLSDVAKRLGGRARPLPDALLAAPDLPEETARWVRGAAGDLTANAGKSVLLAGDGQPAAVHAAVHATNELLGNAGSTVTYGAPPPLAAGSEAQGLGPLSEALERGDVDTLIVLEGNPAYAADGALDFVRMMGLAGRRAYLGLYENETAAACQWFLPALHYLESWGDARAHDGTASLVQPLVGPLWGGFSPVQVLAAFAGVAGTPHRLLRQYWAEHGLASDGAWDDALRRGFLPETAFPDETVECDLHRIADVVRAASTATSGALELQVVRDFRVVDGRFANNALLQELPDPMTRLSWGNAALVSKRTAGDHGLVDGQLVRIRGERASVEIPVLIQRGHADGAVTLSLGYGRSGAENVARGVGVAAAALLAGNPTPIVAVRLEPLPKSVALPLQYPHDSVEGRDILRTTELHAYRTRGPHAEPERPMLYEFARSATEQWAMSIDLTACTGCSACVIACQVENNVPVVGAEWVLRNRQMHWIRIDRYLTGEGDDVAVSVLPMLCQHCEKAPCEYVCPVGATTHSDEGLNEMTYNRCVGTRFCSNNCPYKVRRFNYLNYNLNLVPVTQLVKNPRVTVRGRGVMEKCTYCVQRIRAAEIQAEAESRRLRPDEVVTACAQTCPTRAIVFGSLTADSDVVRLARSDRRYDVLGELGTRPRTSYLERITNPDPNFGKVG